jgi:hypothetical protein
MLQTDDVSFGFVLQGRPCCSCYIIQCIQVHGSLLHSRVHICCHSIHSELTSSISMKYKWNTLPILNFQYESNLSDFMYIYIDLVLVLAFAFVSKCTIRLEIFMPSWLSISTLCLSGFHSSVPSPSSPASSRNPCWHPCPHVCHCASPPASGVPTWSSLLPQTTTLVKLDLEIDEEFLL